MQKALYIYVRIIKIELLINKKSEEEYVSRIIFLYFLFFNNNITLNIKYSLKGIIK